MDFTFTRNNLHLLKDYIYYNLQLCLLWIYEVTIIDLYLKTFRSLLFIKIKDRFYEDVFIYCMYLSIYLWYLWYLLIYIYIYLFILFYFIYLFIYLFTYLPIYLFFKYLFIRKLYLLEVMQLDWIIKSKRSIIYELLQIVYFQKVLNVSDMEYFMYPSMFRQFNVYNIVEEPGRMYLPGTLELLTFISKLLVFMWHTLAYKKSSWKF